jgi:hypothetical protein
MIDVNYLSYNYTKELNKEANQLKFFFSLANEVRQEIDYIKSIGEIENKTIDPLGKTITNIIKNYTTEINNQFLEKEDLTNLNKLSSIFMNNLDTTSNFFAEFAQYPIITKLHSEIKEEILEYSKGSQDQINIAFKDLINSRNKFKSFQTKHDKMYKDMESTILSKRKIENDEKHSYNSVIKDKVDDKILNLMNEFEDNKIALNTSFDECKTKESSVNELLKNYFIKILKLNCDNIKKITKCFDSISGNKFMLMNNMNENTETAKENLNQTELELENLEKRYSEMKGTPFGN